MKKEFLYLEDIKKLGKRFKKVGKNEFVITPKIDSTNPTYLRIKINKKSEVK